MLVMKNEENATLMLDAVAFLLNLEARSSLVCVYRSDALNAEARRLVSSVT